jgi:hypothetical protein
MASPYVGLTALPNGVDTTRRTGRVAVLITPRTDQSSFQASPFANWTERLRNSANASGEIEFQLTVDKTSVPVAATLRLEPALWPILFSHIRTAGRRAAEIKHPEFRSAGLPKAAMIQQAQLQDIMLATIESLSRRDAEVLGAQGRAEEEVIAKTFQAYSKAYNLYMSPKDSDSSWLEQERLECVLRSAVDSPKVGQAIKRDLARLGAELDRGDRLNAAAISGLLELHGVIHSAPNATEAEAAAMGRNQKLSPSVIRQSLVRMSLRFDARNAGDVHTRANEMEDDFDRALTRVTQHPALLAALGLVLDVDIPLSHLLGDGTLIPGTGAIAGVPIEPRITRYAYRVAGSHPRFVARGQATPSGPGVIWGMLNLHSDAFTLDSADRAGAHLKLVHEGESAARRVAHGARIEDSDRRSDEMSGRVPAGRSSGITLLWSERDEHLASSYLSSRAIVASENSRAATPLRLPVRAVEDELYAEHITAGYRVDVWDNYCKRWTSLCGRVGSFEFLNSEGSPIEYPDSFGNRQTRWVPTHPLDVRRLEGVVRQGVVRPKDGGGDLIEVSEIVFRWDNWSLTTPFVERPVEIQNEKANTDIRLRLRGLFQVPEGSLTPLRYGVRYRFRCRAVDAAGNSLSLNDCDDATDPVIPAIHNPAFLYSRHEPVAAPVVALAKALDPVKSPGKQLNRMVVRRGFSEVAQRWLVAPRVAQKTAEIHGRFDDDGLLPGGLKGFRLQSDGSLLTVAAVQHVDPVPSDQPELNNPIMAFDQFHRSSEKCGYYPDPFALSATIDVVDDQGTMLQRQERHRFYPRRESWPNAVPFMIEVIKGDYSMLRDQPVTWRWRDRVLSGFDIYRVLEIVVRPHAAVVLRVRSAFEETDIGKRYLEWMSLWRVLQTTAVSDRVLKHALRGGVPLINPTTEINIIHAVATPPLPALSLRTANRAAENVTCAHLTGEVSLRDPGAALLRHAAAGFTLEATWSEWIDDIGDPAPRRVSHAAQVIEGRISESHQTEHVEIDARHEFDDTRHRMVDYRTTIVSRHQEYYPASKSRRFSSSSEPTHRKIDSSKRPDPPVVSYIVPTFQWDTHEHGKSQSETVLTRKGGGLRIYIERPWYSSGDGELLGVVLLPDEVRKSPSVLDRFTAALNGTNLSCVEGFMDENVTIWGADPIWSGGDINDQPYLANFKSGRPPINNLLLPELSSAGRNSAGGLPVTVLPYEVRYDRDRRLWFADIDMDPTTAYNPFVRFALVRLQPNSLSGEELSRVTRADFAQLVPDRVVTVTRRSPGLLRVTVEGTTYRHSAHSSTGTVMKVVVEEQRRVALGPTWHVAENDKGIPVEAEILPTALRAGVAKWTADLQVNHRFLRRYRVTVREYEQHLADKGTSLIETVPVERLVYAGMIVL